MIRLQTTHRHNRPTLPGRTARKLWAVLRGEQGKSTPTGIDPDAMGRIVNIYFGAYGAAGRRNVKMPGVGSWHRRS
jgi:hypothetical protein